jgi:hypothetical protein
MSAMMFPMGMFPPQDESDPVPLPPADIVCHTLQEVCETYQKPCPYKPGDLVTPRRGYWIKGAGEPHIVVEVFDPPIRLITDDVEEAGSMMYGARFDIRVACMSNHTRNVVAFVAESWAYEPYNMPNGDKQ